MTKGFQAPEFRDGALEFRFEIGEVCIYGTPEGLRRLAGICAELADGDPRARTEHVHLEDVELLTAGSLRGTIAVFRR